MWTTSQMEQAVRNAMAPFMGCPYNRDLEIRLRAAVSTAIMRETGTVVDDYIDLSVNALGALKIGPRHDAPDWVVRLFRRAVSERSCHLPLPPLPEDAP
jgi:hypothetical protein